MAFFLSLLFVIYILISAFLQASVTPLIQPLPHQM
jgi:hypothetical protein